MSAKDWQIYPYKVFHFIAESPLHLQGWLEKMLVEEELVLIAASGDLYIFKPLNPRPSRRTAGGQ